MYAEELRLRLFLEGIEVPVIGANVSMSSDFPAAASIQIVATPQALRLKPRTLVHLFFKDEDSTPLTAGEVQPYSLLFCGDLLSVSFNKTEGTRSITLSCKDHRSYYDLAYTYLWRSSDLQGNIQGSSIEKLLKSKGAFAGANSSINFITKDGVAGFISNIFKDPKPFTPQFRNCSGVLGGVIRSIEAFTGIAGNSRGGSNAFFSFAAARLNLLGQLGVYSNDDTPAKLLASQHLKSLLTGRGDQLGDLTTLNQIIRYILGFIYYRMSPNTCPMFRPIGEFETEGDAKTALSKSAQDLFNYIRAIKDDLTKLKSEYSTEQINELDKGSRTKLVDQHQSLVKRIRDISPDSLMNSISISDTTMREWEKADVYSNRAESSFSKAFSDPGSANWGKFSHEKWSGTKQLYNFLNEIAKLVNSNSLEANNFKGYGATVAFFIIQLCKASGPRLVGDAALEGAPLYTSYRNASYKSTFSSSLIAPLGGILDLLSKSQKDVATAFTQQTTPRLFTTLIMPDLFFGVAPRCNVLFPDMYYTLSYSRDVSSEVTRFQLSTAEDKTLFNATGGVDQIHFYAPSTDELSSMQSKILSSKDTNKTEDAWTGNRLLNHELMTGIKPEFSSMNRMMLEQALLEDRKEKPARDDFYIRIANYQFLKKRLASRNMSVTGIFNPSAVVGLPMIVIDSAHSETSEPSRTGRESMAEQFIGMVVSLSHSLTQQGGSTSYQLSHVRPHRSMDDEFINKLSLGVRAEPKMASVKLSYAVLLDDIVRLSKLPAATSEDDKKLTEALHEFRILMSVTSYSGTKGQDFMVSDSYPHAQSTKAGSGFMARKKVPSTSGAYSTPRTEKLVVQGEPKEVWILGVHVLDETPAGGSKDISGRTVAELVKFLTGEKDQKSKIISGKYEAYIDEYNVYNEEKNTVDPSISGFFADLRIKINPFTLASEVLSLPIRALTDVELIKLCTFIKSKGCRFPTTSFSSVELFYEDESAGLINPPIEEAMRPSFVDVAYASPNIGEKVYKELLGVNSVVDVPQALLDPYNIKKGTTSIGYKGGSSRGAYGETVEVLSQEDAIDFLCLEYAKAKDKSAFARKYVKRPFANINDVIFSENSVHFKAYASNSQINNENKRIPYMGMAIEVGVCEPLMEGFIEASKEQIAYLEKAVDNRVDVRATRSESVLDYTKSLTSRGLKG
jgi:hypothetical protein